AYELDIAFRKQRALIKLERVAMFDVQPGTGESFAQEINQAFVFFDRKDLCPARENLLGQRTKSRADLNYEISCIDLCLLHNPAGNILIMKKILAERF